MSKGRRDFLKASLLTAAAASISKGLNAASPAPTDCEMKDSKYRRQLECDVVVVGAGSAGVPAAISAARNGAKVILLDDDALLGGAPVDMFVAATCGDPFLGIYKQMRTRLTDKYDLSGIKSSGGWFFPTNYAFIIAQMVRAEKNITVISSAPVTGVIMDSAGNTPKICGVEFLDYGFCKSSIKAKIVIDATGTGLVSELAGATCLYGADAKSDFNEGKAPEKRNDTVMPCTLMSIMQAIRPDAKIERVKENPLLLCGKSGHFNCIPEDKPLPQRLYYLNWTASRACDTRDNQALARIQNELMDEVVAPLIDKYLDMGFAINVAPKIGVRECRRVLGHSVIDSKHVAEEKFPDDSVSHGRYWFDIWVDKGDFHGDPNEAKLIHFGMPYGAGVPKGVDNLLTAGKHISGTSLAMSVYRVQPIVGAFGEAMGAAAAMCAANKTSPMNLELKTLQKQMVKQGVLPERFA